MFHVSLLRRVIGDHPAATDLPTELLPAEEEFEPADILEVVDLPRSGKACHKVLVLWHNRAREEATWMSCADFKQQFPGSNLEDKVCSDKGGIVKSGYKVYSRRKKAPNIQQAPEMAGDK